MKTYSHDIPDVEDNISTFCQCISICVYKMAFFIPQEINKENRLMFFLKVA